MAQREWKEIRKFEEILFEEYHGIAKITINRPRYRNAFTPKTTLELSQAFALCREMQNIRVVLLTGAGDKAFCSGRHACQRTWRVCRRRGGASSECP